MWIFQCANIQVCEYKFKESDVYKADNVFITNSSAIILEANKLNGKKLKVIPEILFLAENIILRPKNHFFESFFFFWYFQGGVQ